MSYVRVEPSFWRHRKTLRLRIYIADAAWWLPIRLWSYAVENQPDGDFTKYTAEELAVLLAYLGDAQAMLQALQQTGFMDGMKIHDWEQYNGYHRFFHERAKRAAEARWSRDKNRKDKKRLDEMRGDKQASCYDASSINPSDKIRSRPKSREEVVGFVRSLGLPETDAHYCFDHWQGNGFKNAGKPILDWKATIRSWQHANHLPSQKRTNPSAFHKPQQTDPDELTGRNQYTGEKWK